MVLENVYDIKINFIKGVSNCTNIFNGPIGLYGQGQFIMYNIDFISYLYLTIYYI